LAAACPCLPANAGQDGQSGVVWRIGTFDRSSNEFAGGSPEKPVRFVIGQSDPSKNWFAVQPVRITSATEEKNTANGSSPWAIKFSLPEKPAATYTLHVALLVESASVPTLHVSINGSRGKFYLYPDLDFENGDQNSSFDAVYSHADVEFAFPGSYLHQGLNTITLQAVEEAEQYVPDAGLNYDAIELDSNSSDFNSQMSKAQTVPTIFYRQRNGTLHEFVDVFVRNAGPIRQGSSVDLEIDGRHYREPIRESQDFGEDKVEFEIPEFPSGTQAQLHWNLNGRERHKLESINPAKKWELFLVPHIHLDIGYTDYQSKVAAIHSRVIDEALALTASRPEFRFSLDGDWPLAQFLKNRTPVEQQTAIAAIQKEQLFVPAQYANLLTGFPSAETLIRSLYPSANFSRTFKTPFNYANITDVPSFSWSYASILASAGIHELVSGSNQYRSPVLLQGHLNESSPMWWEGPDGQKVLLWYSRHYQQMQFLFGLPPMPSAGRDTLPLFLQQCQSPSYRANAAILYGTQAENTDLFPQQAELVEQWNNIYAYPHLQYSGFDAALQNIAQQFGDAIPVMRGDGGPYWEDGVASDALYAAMERENEARGPSAEKLSTLASFVDPRLAVDKTDLDEMWTDMLLMDEHTWTSGNSVDDPASNQAVQQLEVKDQYAVKAQQLDRFLLQNSMADIANSISTGSNSLVVFNTLNWQRSGLVSVDLDNWRAQIVDKVTGQIVPVEVVGSGKDFRHVRFIATDIPALGYKVYELRETEKAPDPALAEQKTVLESHYYRVTLDPQTGAVRSIYDKQLQHELVDQQSPHRFGQYLYVTGGDKTPNSILQYSRVYPKPDLEIHPAHEGRLVSTTHTPWGWVARLESTDTNTPVVATEILIFDEEKKIEFVEDVNKTSVTSREAAYFAFPFAMDRPKFQYEIQNGTVNPARDLYPGAGHEWFSAQHWVSVEQDGVSGTVMPLDASLVTLGDINRGSWPAEFGQRQGTIFSYAMNNYWNTNYRGAQGGSFRFRYVITSAGTTSPTELSRKGWEEMTPLESDLITTQDKAQDAPQPLSGAQQSFLRIDDPALLLETWKAAEDGNGSILRFLDLGGTTRDVTVETPMLKLREAWQTDAVERDQKQLSRVTKESFKFTIHPHEILTVRVLTEGPLQAPAR
jgi:hypothetical protein